MSYHTRLFRLILTLIFSVLTLQTLNAQARQRDRIEKIKSLTGKYKWGEGESESKDEANTNAINSLISQIKLTATGKTHNEWANDEMGEGYSRWVGTFDTHASASLQNLEEISFRDGDRWTVFRYISTEDLQKAYEDRIECERDLIHQGMAQEKHLNIAGALRYYNWALTMIAFYKDNLSIEVEGESRRAGEWLPEKISSVLRNIKFEIVPGRVEEDPSDYDRYTVILSATYAGKPVSALDISYFNGDRNYTAHAKSGEAALKFPDLNSIPRLDLDVIYSYYKEAREITGSADLRAAYTGSEGAFDGTTLASHGLSLKYLKGSIKELKSVEKSSIELSADASTKPLTKKEPSTVSRPLVEDGMAYIEVMKRVETAIRERNYQSVADLFTPEGYELFKLMTSKGKVSVASNPEYKVEKSLLFTIGRGIPVVVKTGNHISKEVIVFRFEQGKPIIKSMAYALTARAENDIFRKADWSMESRYSLLTFMEDYQTAFALQRLDYIKTIFSDDAIIITGKRSVSDSNKGAFHDGVAFNLGQRNNVVFKRQTKEQYINNVETLFKNNKWTHIEFEENDISKSSTGGLLDHEIMWIEIRQNWTSASGYNDTGFLGLQINLKPTGSQINIRTWTPEFIEIDDLKKKFSTEINL